MESIFRSCYFIKLLSKKKKKISIKRQEKSSKKVYLTIFSDCVMMLVKAVQLFFVPVNQSV